MSADFALAVEEARRLLDAATAAGEEADWARIAQGLGRLADELERAAVPEQDHLVGRRFDLPNRGQMLTPHLALDRVDADGASGVVRFGRFHLGSNSAAHGGSIALLFDEVMGHVVQARGTRARTAYLTTHYRAITPIEQDLRVVTAVDRSEGRKSFMSAAIWNGSILCAEADALFVDLRPGQP